MNKVRILLTIFMVALGFSLYSQGETCATARKINNLPYSTPVLQNETTCGKGNNYTSKHRCGNIFMGNEEFMYEYTPANDVCVSATASPTIGGDAPIALFVTEGCPDDNNAKCVAQFTNPDNAANTPKPATLTDINLEGGKTYYFQVTARSECFTFTFNLTTSTNCTPNPTGYDCENAETFTTLPYDTVGATNCNRKTMVKEGNYCYSTFYNDSPTYLYKFCPTKTGCIKITGRTADATLRMTMHNSCPTYSDTTCKKTYYFYTFSERIYYETVTAGECYYFAISGGTTCSAYDLKFEEIPDDGATCAKAIDIQPDGVGYYEKLNMTTQCMGDDTKEEPKCLASSWYDDGNEVYFKYTSPGNECITASAFNVNGYYLNLSMFKGCPSAANTNVYASACSRYPDYEASVEYTISDPGDYYFIVSGYKYKSGSYEYYYDRDFDFRFSTAQILDIGKDCAHADTLPSTMNPSKTGISVQCKNDDYDPADVCDNPLIGGSDYVFVYTAPKTFCGTLVGKNVKGTGGLMIYDACPDAGPNCLGATGCETACDSIYVDMTFEQGKKYWIVGAATTGNYFQFDVSIRKREATDDGCAECKTNDCKDCLNSDFELGSFARWKGFTGIYATPKQTAGLDTSYINDPLSRHTIMNAGGYDPVVGDNKLRTTGPIGKRYATRLGNRSSGRQADVVYYEFTVTPQTKNFFYYYAVVFNDPSHTVDDQPTFGVEMVAIDENGIETEIGCAAYQVYADPNDPTFTETYDHVTNSTGTTIRWKDWTLVTVPLDNYMGQDVRIEFTTRDCDLGGHYGYAYIDAFCGDIDIESNTGKYAICPGESLELTAPDGFASYQWSTGATTKDITVNTPGNYTVILTPFSENPLLNCQVTLDVEVTFSDDPTADFTFDEGCIDQFIDFTDQSLGSPSFPIEKWSWDFGEGTGEYNDTNRTHTFPGPGTYDVRLAVVNTGGCRDTTEQTITIPEFPTLDPLNAIDSLVICEDDTIRLYADDLGDVDYNWTGPANYSSTSRLPLLDIRSITQDGNYVIEAISKADPCLKTYDTTYVDVIEMPEYSITEDETLCFLDRELQLFATGGEDENSYTWSPANVLDNPNSQSPIANPDSTVTISVSTTHTYCPDSTMEMVLTIDYYKEMLSIVDEITVCEGAPLEIATTTGDPITDLVWETPMGDVETDEELSYPAATQAMNGYFYVTAYLDNPEYCQFAYDSVLVTVKPAPEADVNPLTALACIGEEVTFTASNTMNTITWTNEDGDTVGVDQSFTTVVDDKNYYVDYTDNLGCFNRDTVFADEYTVVKPDLGKDRLYCIGDDYTIRVRNANKMLPGYTYLWNTGETSDRIRVDTTGDYILTVSHLGCENRDTVNITFQDPANFTMGNDTLLCETDSLFFDFTGFGEDISWNDGYSDFTRWVKYPGGFFSVEIESGACELEDDIVVSFEDFYPATLPNDTAICLGEVLTINADPVNQSYEWRNNDTLISTAEFITVADEGNHNLSLTSYTNVCRSTDEMLVTVLSPNALNFPDQHICETDSAYIDATIPFNGAKYTWGDGFNGPARWIKDAQGYTITIEAGPCIIQDTLFVTHDVVPTFELGTDQVICEDNTTTVTPDNTNWPSYLWNDGTTTPTNTINTAGQHILTATNGLCSYSDTMTLFVDTIPTFELGPDMRICETNDTVITTGIVNPAITHLWNTGATENNITVSTAATYSVTATNGLCTYTDQIDLTVQQLPGVDLGPDQVKCLGDVARIGFTAPNSTYEWNTGATTDSITVNATNTYTLTVNQELCSETASIDVSFDVLTKPDLGEDIVQCDVIDTTLDARTVAESYSWTLNGQSITGTSRSLPIALPGTYVVTAIQGTCTEGDTILVSIKQSPMLTLSTDSILCQGERYDLSATTDAENPSFTWSTGETADNIRVAETGIYSLTMVDGVCTVTNETEVIFVPHPFIDMPAGAKICEDDVITIGEYFNSGDTNTTNYSWSTGENTPVITINNEGRYIETASIEHCFDSDYFDLEVVKLPQPNMTPSFTTCFNELLPINTGLPELATTWNMGGAGYSIIPRETGTYTATITDGPCVVTESVFIVVNPIPTEELEDVYVCPKDSTLLTVNTPNATAIWNGITENPHVVYPGEKITLEIINQYGCSVEQEVNVFEDRDCPDDVYIPNSFTPNNDNVNETFVVSMSEKVVFKSFKVFDRWGALVYSCEGQFKSWNGFYQGRLVKNGVYAYTFEYLDQYDKPHTKMGHITVYR